MSMYYFKPCPKCGNFAIEIASPTMMTGWSIRCNRCHCILDEYDNWESARNAWDNMKRKEGRELEKIENCPFCGTDHVYLQLWYLVNNMWTVECKRCTHKTGYFINKKDAVNNWNHIAQLVEVREEKIKNLPQFHVEKENDYMHLKMGDETLYYLKMHPKTIYELYWFDNIEEIRDNAALPHRDTHTNYAEAGRVLREKIGGGALVGWIVVRDETITTILPENLEDKNEE